MDFGKSARPYLAELIGTFALTFIGAGSIASGLGFGRGRAHIRAGC